MTRLPRLILAALFTAIALIPRPGLALECTTPDGARLAFTAADQKLAQIPGIPGARFFADDAEAFLKAVPKTPGPWLAISGGGADGAYSAGVLNGWSQAGTRPDFSAITGISAGATIAPFAFLGEAYDKKLRENYTTINAGDIFEDVETDQSLLDTWPLKDLITRQVTPALIEAVAREHAKGRRLFVVTMNLDSERRVVWDMGAIASNGGEAGIALFRDVIMASSSVPGLFPPVTIDLEADGKCVREVHIDGSAGGPFYVAPEAWLAGEADFRLPATDLYILMNAIASPWFELVQPNVTSLLGRAISITLKYSGMLDAARAFRSAEKDGVPYHLAYIGPDFTLRSHGAFDGVYMEALFKRGEEEGRAGTAFRDAPPPVSKR